MSNSCAGFTRQEDGQRELEELELQTRMQRIRNKILVLSGKGGVGKSTVAANLAMALAAAGKAVGLLDVDVHGPSIPQLLGITGQTLGHDQAGSTVPVSAAPNLVVASVGLLLESPTDAVIWRGPMKYNVIRQLLKDVAWGELDYLVIDAPPGTGDEPLAVAQLVGAGAQAVIVTTPQDLAVADVRRSIGFCRTLELPIAGLVENMSGMSCPHCQQTIDLFTAGGGAALAREMDIPFLGRIPLDPAVVVGGDCGQPFVASAPTGPAALAFGQIVAPILAAAKPASAATSLNQPKAVMKIAIPTADRQLCMHFGHCQEFAMVEVEVASQSIGTVSYLVPPPHEPGVLPRWLAEQGATLIIAGGMGQRAQQLFEENQIKVVTGASSGSAETLVAAYLQGSLQLGDNVCSH